LKFFSRPTVATPLEPATEAPDLGGPGVLAVTGLAKSYRGRQVVQDAGLAVRNGEAVGLLGPNGAGKTTVFYMITGLVAPDRGRISLDGHDVTRLPMYRRARLGIGYLPQEASIFRGLNVEDNIRAVLEVVEPDRARRESELDNLLEEEGDRLLEAMFGERRGLRRQLIAHTHLSGKHLRHVARQAKVRDQGRS
jgi:lipopolysaccharide export system ATP-binding protein